MALESATYISDLVSTNPTSSDNLSQGDDHIRLIKATLKSTFPNVSNAVTATHTELNKLAGLATTSAELGYLSGTTSSVQTQLNNLSSLKAPLADPTFTGTVTLPSTTSVGNVSATELGYLDGVTSGLQGQIDLKAPIANPTFTGTPAAPTASAYTNTTQVATTAQVYSTVTNVPVNYQTVSSYTLQLSDAGKLVALESGSGVSLTIPTNSSVAFPIGTRIDLFQSGAGQITVGGSGVTILSSGSKVKTLNQFSAATLIKSNTDQWLLMGALV